MTEHEYTGPTAASAIAMAMVTKKLREGGTISFPSLGITLDASNLKGEAMSPRVSEAEAQDILRRIQDSYDERKAHPMTEHDTIDHVAQLRELADFVGNNFDGATAARMDDAIDALAARLAAAEARCQTRPEVWAVVELDYDDYPVGAPLSYQWTEQGAKDWARQHGPRHPARTVQVRQIRIDGDLTDGIDES